jgi:hypothetical protein
MEEHTGNRRAAELSAGWVALAPPGQSAKSAACWQSPARPFWILGRVVTKTASSWGAGAEMASACAWSTAWRWLQRDWALGVAHRGTASAISHRRALPGPHHQVGVVLCGLVAKGSGCLAARPESLQAERLHCTGDQIAYDETWDVDAGKPCPVHEYLRPVTSDESDLSVSDPSSSGSE